MARTFARPACLLLIALLACGRETPRDQLAQMGVRFEETSFVEAAEEGDLHVVRLFLAGEMPADAGDRPALVAAAAAGHADVVSELLSAGADVSRGAPLLGAAEGGHAEVLRTLLAASADAAAARDDGMTVLMLAAREGHPDALRVLLDHGAAVDARDPFGNTALLHAAAAGHAPAAAVLLEAGADPDLRTPEKGTFALGLAAARDDVALAQALLDAGAEPDRRDREREMTALVVAALKGSAGVAQLLLERGADPEASDRDGSTPLMIAADAGHDELVRRLLDQGAEVDRRGPSGTTALMFASLAGHESVVHALLEAGADPSLETEGRYSALSAARHEGHESVAVVLREASRARGAAQPEARQWARFARYGDAYRTPSGWEAVDPFRSDAWYWGDYSLLGIDRGESPRTRRALLRNPALRSQILLVRGPVLEWMPRILDRMEPLDGQPGIGFTDHVVRGADGSEIDYLVIERAASANAPATRHVFGVADLGREALLIDAGGPADTFDGDAVVAFLRSLRVHTDPAPSVTDGPRPASPGGLR